MYTVHRTATSADGFAAAMWSEEDYFCLLTLRRQIQSCRRKLLSSTGVACDNLRPSTTFLMNDGNVEEWVDAALAELAQRIVQYEKVDSYSNDLVVSAM